MFAVNSKIMLYYLNKIKYPKISKFYSFLSVVLIDSPIILSKSIHISQTADRKKA